MKQRNKLLSASVVGLLGSYMFLPRKDVVGTQDCRRVGPYVAGGAPFHWGRRRGIFRSGAMDSNGLANVGKTGRSAVGRFVARQLFRPSIDDKGGMKELFHPLLSSGFDDMI